MKRYILAVLVRNRFGVLNRVTSMFRRRQFNISALTVSQTESPDLSRITVVFDGTEQAKNQLIDQLYRLPDIGSIREMTEESAISSELLLVKIKNTPETREALRFTIEAFGATTAEYTRETVTLQLAGDSRKLDAFVDLMRDFTILEICRTGVVALARGATVIGHAPNI